MSVNGPQVGKAQFLEDGGGHHQIFNAALQAAQNLDHITAEFHVFEPTLKVMLNLVIGFPSTQLVEILTHSAHVFRNGHFVIVEHHNHFFVQCTSVIQCLEGHAAGHGAIANNSHHIVILLLQVPGHGHA